MPKGFGKRFYQQWGHAQDLRAFRVHVQETDLLILALKDLSQEAESAVIRYRAQIEKYSEQSAEFRTSLTPLDFADGAPPIIQAMTSMTKQVGVGPFAAVAGAIAEFVGKELLPYSSELIVENGGDIFVAGSHSRVFGIYAGNSPLSGKIALKIAASQMPCGICTSSGTVGHSLSFGKADAVTILAQSAALADACATAIGNMIATASDIAAGLQFAEQTAGIDGAVIIVGARIGAWGKVQFISQKS